MAVTFVPFVGNVGELAHLTGVQRTVGNSNTQHISMKLQIQAVHQAQRLEFIFSQRSVQTLCDLPAKLLNTVADKFIVEFSIEIHGLNLRLFAVEIVGWTAHSKCLTEVRWLNSARIIYCDISEIGSCDLVDSF